VKIQAGKLSLFQKADAAMEIKNMHVTSDDYSSRGARFPEVSVVMPTLNCRYLIESHAEEIRRLCGEVGEIVVVDSFSEDGTVEFLESALEGLRYRVIQRPRGLYASWNAGIVEAGGEWIHVATAGDLIGIDELGYLLEIARSTAADVVTGIPRFVDTEGGEIDDRSWPIVELFQRRGDEEIIQMSGTELVAFALVNCRPDRRTQSWLGSSASNLYRASCLKRLPFPTDVGPSGDTLWALMNAKQVNATFCRRRTGRFVVHERDPSVPDVRTAAVSKVYADAWSDARDWLLKHLDEMVSGVEVKCLVVQMLEDQIEFSSVIQRLRKRRKEAEDLKAYLDALRQRVPRRLRRFIFPKFAPRAAESKAGRAG